MVIGAAALAGVPWLSGWYSKDAILLEVLARYAQTHDRLYLWLYAAAVLGAFCTAFYIARLLCLTFLGESRAEPEKQAHAHEAPLTMALPLLVLAAFSLLAGMVWHGLFIPEGGRVSGLGTYNISAEGTRGVERLNEALAFAATLCGLALAWLLYVRKARVPDPEAAARRVFYRLSLHKFYVDEAYQAFIVGPFVEGARLAHWVIEMLCIDLLVTGTGKGVAWLGGYLRRLQTGLVNFYAAAMLLGALALLIFLLRS
jgi:NADH-quinone oxidoreductase subunit L